MPLILAIEPDRRQAARISSLARERLSVELLVVDSAERALEALKQRTPDLILTPHLLSPKDEAALDERLRQLDTAGANVQTLMIPVLASSGRRASGKGSLLNRLRRVKDEPATEGGCDPAVFAAQITEYLEKAADERAAKAAIVEDERVYQLSEPQPPIVSARPPIDMPAEPVVAAAERYEFEFQQNTEPEVQPDWVVPSPLVDREIPGEISVASPVDRDFRIPETFSKPSSEPDEFFQSPDPTPARQVQHVEKVPTALEEFVAFDELSVVDSPLVGFDELTAAMEYVDVEPINLQAFATERAEETSTTIEAMSVLDALEIQDEPELPVAVDFQFHERVEQSRRPAVVATRVIDDDETEPDPSPSDFDFESDLWMPLPVAARGCWPTLEGPTVKATFTPSFDAPPDPDVEFAPPPSPEDRGSAKKRKGKPYQDEWGFFDPVQCGFAALLAKLDEVTDTPDGSGEPAKASR